MNLLNKNTLLFIIALDLFAIAIGALPSPWAFIITAALVGLLFIVQYPLFGISIFLIGSYIFSFFLGESQLITIIIVLICLTSITIYYINRKIPYRGMKNDFATLSFLLFSALLVIGFLYTPNKDYAISKIYRYVMFNSLAFMIPFIFNNDLKSLKKLYINLFYVALGLIVLSSILIITTSSYTYARYDMNEKMNPIWIARIIGVGILISLYNIYLLKDHTLRKILLTIYILAGLWIIVLTGARAPLIALVISSMILIMFIEKRSRSFKIIASISIILLLTIFFVLIPTSILMSKYATIGARVSILQRFALWEEAINMTSNNILIGKGTGGFQIFSAGFAKYPHNIFLEASAELGIIGLLIMISFVSRPLWNVTKMLTKERAFGVMILSLWVFNLFNAQFSGDFTGNYLLWFFIGSWVILSLEKKRSI